MSTERPQPGEWGRASVEAFIAARAPRRSPFHEGDAEAIIAAGWVDPETHRRAVEEAREQGAGDTEYHVRKARQEIEAERDRLAAVVERVRAGHTRMAVTKNGTPLDLPYCVEDSETAQEWVSWPCPTIRALDGEAQ